MLMVGLCSGQLGWVLSNDNSRVGQTTSVIMLSAKRDAMIVKLLLSALFIEQSNKQFYCQATQSTKAHMTNVRETKTHADISHTRKYTVTRKSNLVLGTQQRKMSWNEKSIKKMGDSAFLEIKQMSKIYLVLYGSFRTMLNSVWIIEVVFPFKDDQTWSSFIKLCLLRQWDNIINHS